MAPILAADRVTLAGDGLARLHADIRRNDPSCGTVAATMIAAMPALDHRYVAALSAVAVAADASGRNNAFHNPAHSREVAINWWLLARIGPPLPDDAIARGLIAAFGHDIGHDGRANETPFRLEAIAAHRTAAMMRSAGIGNQACDTVAAMILASEVRQGYLQLHDHPPHDPRFAALADPITLESARMLRDADLLPSAGTSIAAYHARTDELARELGLLPGALSAGRFFDGVVERRFLSASAQLFAPNLAAIMMALNLD